MSSFSIELQPTKKYYTIQFKGISLCLFFVINVMITPLIEMLELPNVGHMTTSGL